MGIQTQGVVAASGDMNARTINRAQAASYVARFGKLQPGARPAWGKLTAETVIPHLIGAIKMSKGEIPGLPFVGNWLTTALLWPIARTGMLPIPKNITIKGKDGKPVPAIQSPGDVNTLAEELESFISLREAGTLKTAPHPIFGDVGADGWAALHGQHIRHHLKQFGL